MRVRVSCFDPLVLPHVILIPIASSTILLNSPFWPLSGRLVGNRAQRASEAAEGQSPWPTWICCGAIGR